VSEPVLFFDAGCPACRLFARLVLAADTERRIRTAALDSPEADRALGGLSREERYGSYHLVVGERPLGRIVRRSDTARRVAAGLYELISRHRGALARVLPRVDLPR
jgi:predicted DCC family thiol-disulfide oxidoreductase YuxK